MRFSKLLPPLLILSTSAFGANYPKRDWETVAPESTGMDSAKLAALSDFVFTLNGNRRSDALLVIHEGKIVYEKYAFGYAKDMPHLSWSMAKSFSSVLAGIAESEGIISRTSRPGDFYPYPSSTPSRQAAREKVKLLNLLTMSSGMGWVEDYGTKSPLASDVTQMLYMDPRNDMAAYVASREMENTPGAKFLYSTGSINLAMGMLKQQMRKEAYDRYPWEKIFNPIGMRKVIWEKDGAGTFEGGSYIYASARDYARFGYLLLNQGNWKGHRVVPAEWLTLATKTLSPPFVTGTLKPNETMTYGAGFWLNLAAPRWNIPTPFPAAPADTFLAIGHNGQSIIVIPSQDLVLVRLAHDVIDDEMNLNEYLGLAMKAVLRATAVVQTATAVHQNVLEIRARRKNLPPKGVEAKLTSVFYFSKLVASVRAKDYCSCRFVVGQSHPLCTDLVKNGYPIIRFQMDQSKKEVSFGLLPPESAAVLEEPFGCVFL